MRRLLLVLLACLVFVAPASAATVYIRQGASGSGTGADWTNALTTPPTTLVRGNTYYIADTTTGFGQWKITAHTASTTVTTIKKATIADHGTSTGWLDTMGDGQAVFSAGVANEGTFDYHVDGSGYLLIDGNGSSATCGARPALLGSSQTGCGLKFIGTVDNGQSFNWHGGGENSIVRYIEIQGPGSGTGQYSLSADHQGYAIWGSGTAGENVTLQYSYLHHSCTLAGSASHNVFEGNYWADNRVISTVPTHGNIVYVGFGVTDVIFRYNYVNNFNAEGFFITFYSGVPSAVEVYGNVFQSPNSPVDENPRGVEVRDGNTGTAYSGVKIFNNTFVNLGFAGISDRSQDNGGTGCTTCAATNNLSYNASTLDVGNIVLTTNTVDATDRFTAVGTDFSLTAALAGTALASPYDVDIFGNTRGADGVWDRGAIEFQAGGGGGSSTGARGKGRFRGRMR